MGISSTIRMGCYTYTAYIHRWKQPQSSLNWIVQICCLRTRMQVVQECEQIRNCPGGSKISPRCKIDAKIDLHESPRCYKNLFFGSSASQQRLHKYIYVHVYVCMYVHTYIYVCYQENKGYYLKFKRYSSKYVGMYVCCAVPTHRYILNN